MKFTQISNAILDSTQLNNKEKLLFICIIRFNPSFPSYDKLREMTGFSRTTIAKYLASLEKKNFITRHKSGFRVYYDPHPKALVSGEEYELPDKLGGSNLWTGSVHGMD